MVFYKKGQTSIYPHTVVLEDTDLTDKVLDRNTSILAAIKSNCQLKY